MMAVIVLVIKALVMAFVPAIFAFGFLRPAAMGRRPGRRIGGHGQRWQQKGDGHDNGKNFTHLALLFRDASIAAALPLRVPCRRPALVIAAHTRSKAVQTSAIETKFV